MPQAIPVKRNGHESIIWIDPNGERAFFDKADQSLGQVCFVLILKGMNRGFDGTRKRTERSRHGVGTRPGQTPSTEVTFVGWGSKRDATFDAKGWADKGDL